MKLLLSIKPQFAEKIFDGSKTFEFRKAIHRRVDITTAVVYVTRPVGMIMGEFEIQGIESDHPEILWDLTADGAGIDRAFYDSYFADRKIGYALRIGRVTRFEAPVSPASLFPDFTPPQSYMYVSDEMGRPPVDDADQLLLFDRDLSESATGERANHRGRRSERLHREKIYA